VEGKGSLSVAVTVAFQSKAIHLHLFKDETKTVHTREYLRSTQTVYELNMGRGYHSAGDQEFMDLKAYLELVEKLLGFSLDFQER